MTDIPEAASSQIDRPVVAPPARSGNVAHRLAADHLATLEAVTAERPPLAGGGWWAAAARRFAGQRVGALALALLLLIVLVALFAPVIATHDPNFQFRDEGLSELGLPVGPSAQFWLGTDGLGRDMFSRLVYGARVSLAVGTVASCLAVLAGLLVGGTAGMVGGWIDTFLMRFVDLVMSLPALLIILLVVALVGPSLWITIAVIALLGWTFPARVFRAEVLSVRERDYILAARAAGANRSRIFLVHILPQIVPLILITASLGVPGAIFAEAGLGFLGLGVPPPTASWGGMIFTGLTYYRAAPAQVLLPGAAIIVTVICFNLTGSGLRDVLDPMGRNR